MRIHSDTLTTADFTKALREAGLADVHVEHATIHGSRSRPRAYEVRLEAEPRTAAVPQHGHARRRGRRADHVLGRRDLRRARLLDGRPVPQGPERDRRPVERRRGLPPQDRPAFDRKANQSKKTDEKGTLRYKADRGEVFPGATGVSPLAANRARVVGLPITAPPRSTSPTPRRVTRSTRASPSTSSSWTFGSGPFSVTTTPATA